MVYSSATLRPPIWPPVTSIPTGRDALRYLYSATVLRCSPGLARSDPSERTVRTRFLGARPDLAYHEHGEDNRGHGNKNEGVVARGQSLVPLSFVPSFCPKVTALLRLPFPPHNTRIHFTFHVFAVLRPTRSSARLPVDIGVPGLYIMHQTRRTMLPGRADVWKRPSSAFLTLPSASRPVLISGLSFGFVARRGVLRAIRPPPGPFDGSSVVGWSTWNQPHRSLLDHDHDHERCHSFI